MAILIVFEEQKVINLQKNLKWEKTNDQRLLSVRRYRHDLGVRLRTSAVMLALTLLILLIPHIWVISGQRVRSAVEQSETSEMGRLIGVIFDSDHSKKLRLSHAIIQWREEGSRGGGGNRKLFFVLRWTRNTAFCWDSRCLNGVTNNLSHVMVSSSLAAAGHIHFIYSLLHTWQPWPILRFYAMTPNDIFLQPVEFWVISLENETKSFVVIRVGRCILYLGRGGKMVASPRHTHCSQWHQRCILPSKYI